MSIPQDRRWRVRGFSLIEVLIVLTAVAALLAMLMPGTGVLDTARAGRVRQEIETLRGASERWLERGRLDYSGLSLAALTGEGLLPSGWTGSAPWGGSYTVGPVTGTPTRLQIDVTAIPAAMATRLASQLATAGYLASATGTSLTVQL